MIFRIPSVIDFQRKKANSISNHCRRTISRTKTVWYFSKVLEFNLPCQNYLFTKFLTDVSQISHRLSTHWFTCKTSTFLRCARHINSIWFWFFLGSRDDRSNSIIYYEMNIRDSPMNKNNMIRTVKKANYGIFVLKRKSIVCIHATCSTLTCTIYSHLSLFK